METGHCVKACPKKDVEAECRPWASNYTDAVDTCVNGKGQKAIVSTKGLESLSALCFPTDTSSLKTIMKQIFSTLKSAVKASIQSTLSKN